MSEDGADGPWFRRTTWGFGYHFIPIAWQGWATTLVFVAAVLVTIFAGDPRAAHPASVPLYLKMKATFGLERAQLQPVTMAALILGEVAVFLFLIWWKSRTLKPLD